MADADAIAEDLRRLISQPFPMLEGWAVIPSGAERIPLWCDTQTDALDLWGALRKCSPDVRMGMVSAGRYYDFTPGAKDYICPYCGKISANPEDLSNRYCGACHTFEDGLTPLRQVVDETRQEDKE